MKAKKVTLKGKIISSYIVMVILMLLFASVCINLLHQVTSQLEGLEETINNAAIQSITKHNMRESITMAQSNVLKCTGNAIIISGISIVVAIILAVIMIKSEVNPLKKLNNFAYLIQEGDLTAKLEGEYDKELYEVINNLNNAIEANRNMVNNIEQSSSSLLQSTGNVNSVINIENHNLH